MKPVLGYRLILAVVIISSILSAYYFTENYSNEGALIIGLAITAGTYYYYFYLQRQKGKKGKNLEKSILENFPGGVVVIDTNGEIIWYNPKFKEIINNKGFLAGRLNQYLPNLQFRKQSQFHELVTEQIAIKNKIYHLTIMSIDNKLRALFLKDITEKAVFVQKNEVEKPVIGIIQIDNYAQVIETIDEELRPLLLAEMDKIVSEWAGEREGYLKKFTEDKYVIFLNSKALRWGEENKFALLDKVKAIDFGKIPVTLSMGFGINEDSLIDLGRLASLALDLALGRGGDQVVVKSPEKVWFYGGKSQALEKRTRVKARVIAHSLRNLILEAEKVIIMGHESADFDCLGSAMGLADAVKFLGKEALILVEEENETIKKFNKVFEKKDSWLFIKTHELRKIETSNSLLIIIDTHKPSIVMDKELLQMANKIVVIDHHRRAEEFITNVNLVYLEPYASSTSELVTELLQYFDDDFEINNISATVLLAGITIDTKNFVFQTGVRTFEAASYLRSIGADPLAVQKLLRDDYERVVIKAKILEKAMIIKEQIALSYYPEPLENAQVTAAQGADALLNIDGISTSFVICLTIEGGTVISARSIGDINVQVLMETLGGGGHFSIAGVQLKDVSLEEAKEKIIDLITKKY